MNLIENWLTTNKKELIHIASDIFCHPETAYQETYSSNAGIPGNLENSWYRHCIYRCLGFRQANAWISGRIRCTAGDRSRLRT